MRTRQVSGTEFRRVKLPADCTRGGLLTQASILKVTANGTNSSPVTRGVWVMERILGETPPPPPPGVPGVEPDIRGASTLRELLDKHRSLTSCKACHQKLLDYKAAGSKKSKLKAFLRHVDRTATWREEHKDKPLVLTAIRQQTEALYKGLLPKLCSFKPFTPLPPGTERARGRILKDAHSATFVPPHSISDGSSRGGRIF